MNFVKHTLRTLVAALFTVAVASMLTSCPNPIPVELATQITDTDGPVITITGPSYGSAYSTVVQVRGTVTDGGDGDGATGAQVAECTYSVLGTIVEGSFEIDGEGTFNFLFPTRDVDGTTLVAGPATIEITARDWNGNQSTKSVQIVPVAAGDVPGFTVTPANGAVTIAWGDVPGAESYDLFETKYGKTRTNVTSPYPWEGLENGDIYRFQVKAEVPDEIGDDAYSSTIEKMPLSTRSLAPWVREVGYDSIMIEWRGNSNIDEYTVERAPSPDGPWEIRRNLAAHELADDEVEHNTDYWYRVKPNGYPDIVSDTAWGVPGRFLSGFVGSEDTPGWARGVVVAGSYAYVADGSSLQIIDISDPAGPVTVGTRATYAAYGLAVAGSYAYMADYSVGLKIIDISNPRDPVLVGHRDTGLANEVVVAGSYAYVADGGSGLQVIDISDPTDPVIVGARATSNALGVAVAGSYAYVADYTSGLHVIRLWEGPE